MKTLLEGSQRQQSKQGDHLTNYALMSSFVEPSNFKEVATNEDWSETMEDEID